MALGLKPIYEEKRSEFLPDHVYCSNMINEVIEVLPARNYTEPIYDLAKAYGKEVLKDHIRDTRNGVRKDRFIAYCINMYGKTLMK